MDFKKLCRSFMAGMFFPAIFLTFMYTMFYFYNLANVFVYPLAFIPMYIPLLFGLTNYIFLSTRSICPIRDPGLQLWVTGGILGLIVALLGIFMFNIPSLLFNVSGVMTYLPIIFLPLIYGFIFRYIISWLNKL